MFFNDLDHHSDVRLWFVFACTAGHNIITSVAKILSVIMLEYSLRCELKNVMMDPSLYLAVAEKNTTGKNRGLESRAYSDWCCESTVWEHLRDQNSTAVWWPVKFSRRHYCRTCPLIEKSSVGIQFTFKHAVFSSHVLSYGKNTLYKSDFYWTLHEIATIEMHK